MTSSLKGIFKPESESPFRNNKENSLELMSSLWFLNIVVEVEEYCEHSSSFSWGVEGAGINLVVCSFYNKSYKSAWIHMHTFTQNKRSLIN